MRDDGRCQHTLIRLDARGARRSHQHDEPATPTHEHDTATRRTPRSKAPSMGGERRGAPHGEDTALAPTRVMTYAQAHSHCPNDRPWPSAQLSVSVKHVTSSQTHWPAEGTEDMPKMAPVTALPGRGYSSDIGGSLRLEARARAVMGAHHAWRRERGGAVMGASGRFCASGSRRRALASVSAERASRRAGALR